jgi:hypothetical protein
MDFDFDDVLFAPIYEGDLGSDAMLTLANGVHFSNLPDGSALRVLDKTAGAAVQQAARGVTLTIETIRPVAMMRQSTLAQLGLAITDLEGGQLTIFHDNTPAVTWRIKSYQVKPTPSGPGEIEIILIDQAR